MDINDYSKKVQLHFESVSAANLRRKNLSPSKPSLGDIEIYHDFLCENGSKKRILLLGSTPELRTMLSRLGIKKYILADFSYSMIKSSLDLCNGVNSDDEIWVKSDWLSLPFPENSFDVILGDLVNDQFYPAEQSIFFKKIHSLLKPEGSFIVRMHVANEILFNSNPNEIIENSINECKKSGRRKALHVLIASRLRDCLRDKTTQMTYPGIVINVLKNYPLKNGDEKDFIIDAIKMLRHRQKMNINHMTQTKTELKILFGKYFKKIGEKSAEDYDDTKYFPVFNFKPKKLIIDSVLARIIDRAS